MHSKSTYLLKIVLIMTICSFGFNGVFAQTYINSFGRVTAVSNQSILSISTLNQTYHTFAVGEMVVVMQMQDNVIGTNTTNASSFGNISTIANAGNYEIRTISAISGSISSISVTPALTNTYNTGTNSMVQVISFNNLGTNYTTTANMAAVAWNGTIGGVLAFYVTNTLTLQHALSADSAGFRGGSESINASNDFTCVQTSYRASSTSSLGFKGEGIYRATLTTYTCGRAKIINGGGGGSENNTGGGGGSNYTTGGNGGIGWSCSSSNTGNGIGGTSLSTFISGTRIFMGGGGGGGQQNNNAASRGGYGGGIILVKAGTIRTVGTCATPIKITANGSKGLDSGMDGSGGGGAGGTIVLQAATYSFAATCPVTITADGGAGGNVNHVDTHGGGGGGGQGALIFSPAQPTTNTSIGTNFGAGGANDDIGSSFAGSGGGPANMGIISTTVTVLPIKLQSFKGTADGNKVNLDWITLSEKNCESFEILRTTDGINYTAIYKSACQGGENTKTKYTFTDNFPEFGTNYYALLQTDQDGTQEKFKTIAVDVQWSQPFGFYPNPVNPDQELVVDLSDVTVDCVVEISGLAGNVLRTYNATSKHLLRVTHGLENGVYILTLKSAYGIQAAKLVVGKN
jgi:hypothetical protein